jgi:hypothetical protein
MQLAHGNQDHPSMSPRCAKRGGPEAGECFLKLGMTGFPHVEIRSPRSRKIYDNVSGWNLDGQWEQESLPLSEVGRLPDA